MLSPVSEPMTIALPPPISRPIAQPASVSRTADHKTADVTWWPRALSVAVIDGNSLAGIAPAALSPCHRPSAASRTAARSP
ncbi:MAG TPA: hypothetical protein VF070_07210 [Streptosporangiaceae bacterium]